MREMQLGSPPHSIAYGVLQEKDSGLLISVMVWMDLKKLAGRGQVFGYRCPTCFVNSHKEFGLLKAFDYICQTQEGRYEALCGDCGGEFPLFTPSTQKPLSRDSNGLEIAP